MTNAEKFKSAEEREISFIVFCDSHGHDCKECPIFNKCIDTYGHNAAFAWLELEAEDESFEDIVKEIRKRMIDREHSPSLWPFIDRLEAAHNRVAKDVQKQDKHCEYCRPEMSTLHCTARYILESAKKHIEKIERILNGCCDTSHAIAVIGEAKCIIESFHDDERKYCE